MIYLLGLTFLLFLNYQQIKDILIFADDELKHAGPDLKVMDEQSLFSTDEAISCSKDG